MFVTLFISGVFKKYTDTADNKNSDNNQKKWWMSRRCRTCKVMKHAWALNLFAKWSKHSTDFREGEDPWLNFWNYLLISSFNTNKFQFMTLCLQENLFEKQSRHGKLPICRLFNLCIPKWKSWTFHIKLRKCILNPDREICVSCLLSDSCMTEVASDHVKPYNVFVLFKFFFKNSKHEKKKERHFYRMS